MIALRLLLLLIALLLLLPAVGRTRAGSSRSWSPKARRQPGGEVELAITCVPRPAGTAIG